MAKSNANVGVTDVDNSPTMVTGAEPFIGAALASVFVNEATKAAGQQAAKKVIEGLMKAPVWLAAIDAFERDDYVGWIIRVKNLISVRAYLHDITYSNNVLGRMSLAPKSEVTMGGKNDKREFLTPKPGRGWYADFAPTSDTKDSRHLAIEMPKSTLGAEKKIRATFSFFFLNSGAPHAIATELLVLPNLEPRKIRR
ncbi:MAG: hypothetical protein R3C46_10875 [Hyphomonadaceae bacterium]